MKELRSNFEPGSPREAVRRAQWKALGLTDADLLKPKIAVVNSSSELAICFSRLDGIAAVVKEAVREAGRLPCGYLSIYRRAVQPMSTGAVLIEGGPEGPQPRI
jgi:dihydroxyacid dehydratase/phosphogluconate dehydratase